MTTEEGLIEVMDSSPTLSERLEDVESRINELSKRIAIIEKQEEKGGKMRIYNTDREKKEFVPLTPSG